MDVWLTNGQMDGQVDGWMDLWMESSGDQIQKHAKSAVHNSVLCASVRIKAGTHG